MHPGSGDASLVGWELNNTLRYNKVTNVRGSSSSDGMHVCQGQAVNKTLGCRGITWAVYLDGAYSGAQIHGNIFDGSSKGAMIINGGSSINFTNNIVLGAKTYNVELNFCYQSNNSKQEKHVTSWPGMLPRLLRLSVLYSIVETESIVASNLLLLYIRQEITLLETFSRGTAPGQTQLSMVLQGLQTALRVSGFLRGCP